jgi:hypothetical protein
MFGEKGLPVFYGSLLEGTRMRSNDRENSKKEREAMKLTPYLRYLLGGAALFVAVSGCTQETQNVIGRSIQNWTGTDGVLDIYAGDKLVQRFIKIDKISTAQGTSDNLARPYRFGYGYVDENLNFKVDGGEKKVYFEFSDYSTSYIFYENYKS